MMPEFTKNICGHVLRVCVSNNVITVVKNAMLSTSGMAASVNGAEKQEIPQNTLFTQVLVYATYATHH